MCVIECGLCTDTVAMEILTNPEAWLAFITLTVLEIVLGIDNIIFISILTSRLPAEQQARGRFLGLGLAMLMRIGLLLSITWIMQLRTDLFEAAGRGISGRDLVLIIGGIFLVFKSTREVHNSLEGMQGDGKALRPAGFYSVLLQVAFIDIVFSLDSVITAVGLVDHVEVMIAAIVVSVLVMMASARPISNFVVAHPTVKMLALSFLMLIGVTLVAEGLDVHVPKGYVYFAMAFSFGVEMLNIRVRRKQAPLRLRKAQLADLVGDSTPMP
jgi:predicted tellurium resistance membrane protein TerC